MSDYYRDTHGGIFKVEGADVMVYNVKKGDFVKSSMTLMDLDMSARPVDAGEALDAIDRKKAGE